MTAQSPKIGLALGSGSARGWAHIGVIRELEEMGVKIDAIAGCSIGALVGGVYALGRLDELETWARSLTLKQMALLMDPTFIAGGLLRGERVFNTLRQFHFDGPIEHLKIKFAAVATDMDSGEEIWLREGSLLDAVRASTAMPGLLCPSRQADRWLIDGALVNPVPIALARALGCDKVIAVNLNHDVIRPYPSKVSRLNLLLEYARRKLPSYLHDLTQWRPSIAFKSVKGQIHTEEDIVQAQEALAQASQEAAKEEAHNPLNPIHPGYRQVIWSMMNIMQDRITRYRMSLDQPEVELKPDLGHLALMQFHLAEASIEEGRKAVRLQAKKIIAEIMPTKNDHTTLTLEQPAK